MSWIKTTLTSSLGRKLLMAFSGLGLILFLVVHMAGNLLLIKDDGGLAFNEYAHFMAHTTIIKVSEVGLFGIFFLHIIQGLALIFKNKKARPVGYAKYDGASNSKWAARWMGFLGTTILFFLILHLSNFFWKSKLKVWVGAGEHTASDMVAGTDMFDLYSVVKYSFEQPWYTAVYVIAMIALCFHLIHGFSSAFQSIGWNHPKYTPLVKKAGVVYAVLISAGFIVAPLYFLIQSL